MKKIAITIISKRLGGGEQSVINLIENLLLNNVNLYVITNQEHIANIPLLLKEENIFNLGKFYYNELNPVIKILFKAVSKFVNIQKQLIKIKAKHVNQFILENSIEIIHSHLMLDLYLCRLLKQYNPKIKLIYTFRSFLNFSKNIKIHYGIKHEEAIEYIHYIDYYTFISKSLGEYIRSSFPNITEKNSEVIPNGLPKKKVVKYKKNNVASIPNHLNFIFLGGEKAVKGGRFILEAYRILIEERIDFTLTVLGKLNAPNHFFELNNEKNIRIIGFVPPPKHYEYIVNSDVVIMPSISEGFGNVTQEAIYFGKPIIASNLPVFRETIENGKNGLLIEPNGRSLASAMKKLTNNPNLMRKIINNNQKTKVFWVEEIVHKFIQIYQKV